VEIRWNKTNDFSILYYEYDVNINLNDVTKKYEEILKSKWVINRRDVYKSRLNIKQRLTYDLIIRAMNLEEGHSKTDREGDVSRLQLLIGKGGAGKSYVLDSVISILKREYSKDNDKYLIIAPTGKAVSNINGSTIYSHSKGLSLPIHSKLNDLKGD